MGNDVSALTMIGARLARFAGRNFHASALACLAAPLLLAASVGAFAQTASVVEYFHASFSHYFVTGDPVEIARLDAGAFPGWARTGQSFETLSSAPSGLVPMCRFFSTSFAPKSSHFYTPIATECALVKTNPDWQFEGEVFLVSLPDSKGGCSTGTMPLYRYYNNGQGGAPNHRYSTSRFMRPSMLAAGWIPEGNGDGVIACVPRLFSFDNGTFFVGADIQPGTYRTRDNATGCTYQRLLGFTGSVSDLIATHSTDGPAIVTIAPTDKGFISTRCGTWTGDLSGITAGQSSIPDGAYMVGVDVQPTTYRTRKAAPGCYFERLSGFSAALSDIIVSDNIDAPAVITLSATDKGFASARCGTWSQDLLPITASPTTFSDGVFIVGVDVEPGTYRNSDSSGGCYFARLRGFSSESSEIISSNFTYGLAVAVVSQSDKGFRSDRCGTWTKI